MIHLHIGWTHKLFLEPYFETCFKLTHELRKPLQSNHRVRTSHKSFFEVALHFYPTDNQTDNDGENIILDPSFLNEFYVSLNQSAIWF